MVLRIRPVNFIFLHISMLNLKSSFCPGVVVGFTIQNLVHHLGLLAKCNITNSVIMSFFLSQTQPNRKKNLANPWVTGEGISKN